MILKKELTKLIMNKNNILNAVKWLIIANILITLILKVKMLRIFYSWHSDTLSNIVVLAFFAGAVGSIIGLILKKLWGFWSVYVLVPVATYYLGISLSPFVLLFPVSSRTIQVIILNAIMFGATIWLQIKQ